MRSRFNDVTLGTRGEEVCSHRRSVSSPYGNEVRSEREARPEVTLKMLGGTVSTVAPASVRSEREARETEKEPLENLNISRSLNHETWGFALPSKAFLSSWEGEREKLGVLGCTLLFLHPWGGESGSWLPQQRKSVLPMALGSLT
ncbi:unnamed protein product [Arctogadus glacialis]